MTRSKLIFLDFPNQRKLRTFLFSPYSSGHDWDDWFSSTDIESKLQSTRQPRRSKKSPGAESGVNLELREFASIPADDRNEFPFTFGDSKSSLMFIFLKLSRRNSMLV